VWTDPGEFDCGGALEILSTHTICKFSGTARESGSTLSVEGVGLVLEGFNQKSGKITWKQTVQNVSELAGESPVVFVDGNDVVVTQKGHQEVLDLQTGRVRAVYANEIFWCGSAPVENVQEPAGSGFADQRTGTEEFFTCDADGTPVSAPPPNYPEAVGVTLDGKFFWSSPKGLEAVPAD
jgi:hypothetical protein